MLIFFIVLSAIFESNSGNYIKENFEYLFTIHNNKDFYLYLSLMWLFTFPFEITKITTVYYFTPNLFVTTDILSPIFQWIIDIFIKKDKTTFDVIFKIVSFIIIILAVLIFNEMIILNFCDLSIETTKMIKERSNIDYDMANNLNDDESIGPLSGNNESALNIEQTMDYSLSEI